MENEKVVSVVKCLEANWLNLCAQSSKTTACVLRGLRISGGNIMRKS